MWKKNRRERRGGCDADNQDKGKMRGCPRRMNKRAGRGGGRGTQGGGEGGVGVEVGGEGGVGTRGGQLFIRSPIIH